MIEIFALKDYANEPVSAEAELEIEFKNLSSNRQSLSKYSLNDLDHLSNLAALDANQDGYIGPEDLVNNDDTLNLQNLQERSHELPYRDPINERKMSQKEDMVRSSEVISKIAKGAIIEYQVPIHNLPVELEGLKILHLSDLHFKRGWRSRLGLLQNILTSLKVSPDLVLVTGDMVHDCGADLCKKAISLLSQIPGVKFFVMGDHDRTCINTENAVRLKLNKAGFTELNNKEAVLKIDGVPLRIIGLDDVRRGEILRAFDIPALEREQTRILITHNLDVLSARTPGCLDLVLSGHTHAGQINLGLLSGINLLRVLDAFEDRNKHFRDWKSLSWRTLSCISNGFSPKGVPRINAGIDSVGLLTLTKFVD